MAKHLKYHIQFWAGMLVCLATTGPLAAQDQVQPDPAAIAEAAVIPITQDFIIDRSDRMMVEVRINDSVSYPFIVDTGSERTIIANELAALLKLEAGPKLKLATITGQATVGSFLIDTLTASAVNISGLEAPGLGRADLGAFGLLGIDSLEEHAVLLDFAGQKMEVFDKRRNGKSGSLERGMIVVRAVKRAGRMILSNAKIGRLDVDIILDTGAQTSMGNLVLRDRMRGSDRRFDYQPINLRSVTGSILAAQYTQINQISLDGFTMNDLPIAFADNYAFKALNLKKRPAILLGMDVLRMFDRVMIDFANRRVAFALPKKASRDDPNRLAAR